MLFPNCYLSEAGRIALLVAGTCYNAIVFLLAAWVSIGKRAIPKRLCFVAMTVGLAGMLVMISLAIEKKPAAATSMFWVIFNVLGGGVAPMMLLWALVSPTLDLMMLKSKRPLVIKRMAIFIGVFFVYQLTIFSVALKYQYEGNYVKFNEIMSAHLYATGLYCFIYMSLILYFARLLLRQIDNILANRTPDSSKDRLDLSHQVDIVGAKIEAHRNKLRK